jgi:hypothetical protein
LCPRPVVAHLYATRFLWQEKVRLDEGFLKSLREHPVPVREEAISAIGTHSWPIDIYICLAYRLHVLTKPTPNSSLSLHSQFGAGFKKVRQFKPTMTDALSMALAVCPEAEVFTGQDGVTLFPPPPAIPQAEARPRGRVPRGCLRAGLIVGDGLISIARPVAARPAGIRRPQETLLISPAG